MPVLRLYQNGLTGGCPPRRPNPNPVPRGDCQGWSLRTSRGNTKFLYSVRAADLPFSSSGSYLIGLSASLTVRDCPASHDDWIRVRRALIKRAERRGLFRMHWLTEWQKRGVPHLHLAAWFDPVAAQVAIDKQFPGAGLVAADVLPALLKSDWLALCAIYRSREQSQYVNSIFNDLGWLKYLSKHASRGAAHYQRASGTIPEGWEKTGRMWGHLGDFPTSEPLGLELSDAGWFRFRRIVRGWRCAQARSEKKVSPGRVKFARRMLCCSDFSLSRVRGVSEWISLALGLQIIHWISSCGHFVESTIS